MQCGVRVYGAPNVRGDNNQHIHKISAYLRKYIANLAFLYTSLERLAQIARHTDERINITACLIYFRKGAAFQTHI